MRLAVHYVCAAPESDGEWLQHEAEAHDLDELNLPPGRARQIDLPWSVWNFASGPAGGIWYGNPKGKDAPYWLTRASQIVRASRLSHVVDLAGRGVYPIVWSANGRRLLAAADGHSGADFWVVDLTSGRIRPARHWFGVPLDISRGGNTILVLLGPPASYSSCGEIELISVSTSKNRVIPRFLCNPSWNQ